MKPQWMKNWINTASNCFLLLIILLVYPSCSHVNTLSKKSENNSVEMSQSYRFYTVRLQPGDDLFLSLKNKVNEDQIKAASIVSIVGSLTQSNLKYANQKSATQIKKDLEIVSATGTLSMNGSHIHLAVSDPEGKTWGGHLVEGSIVRTTAEITWVEFLDQDFKREHDPMSGYSELKVYKR